MRFSWQAIRRTACFTAALILLGMVTGCGGGKGTVTGTVTGPDGQPLPAGRISFSPPSGLGVSADIKDGKYTAENVPAGENKVAVDTAYIEKKNLPIVKEATHGKPLNGTGASGPPPKDTPPNVAAELAKIQEKREAGLKQAKEELAKYRKIDEKFADPKTSGLSLTVKSGENTFPVDLSKK